MTFDECVAVVTSDYANALDEEKAAAFIAAADIETLRLVLCTPGIKKKFAVLINESLSRKVPTAKTDAAMDRITERMSARRRPK